MGNDRKLKLAEFNRNNILKAAETLFLEQGYVKTTVDDIAKTADCSKATIYVYFKNKEDIYYHIVFEYMELLHSEINHCIQREKSFEETYYMICDSLLRYQQKYPMYFEAILGKIAVAESERLVLSVLQQIYDLGEQLNKILYSFFEKAQCKGELDETIDIMTTVFVMWSSICSLISLASSKQEYMENYLEISNEKFLEDGFKLILKMVVTKGGQ